jgi:hypothetical protein
MLGWLALEVSGPADFSAQLGARRRTADGRWPRILTLSSSYCKVKSWSSYLQVASKKRGRRWILQADFH